MNTEFDTGSDFVTKIGINPEVFLDLFFQYQRSLQASGDTEKLLALKTIGSDQWAWASAAHGGVLPIVWKVKSEREGRAYGCGAIPLDSMPRVLRPAITANSMDHMLISADWRASHWQIIAAKSNCKDLVDRFDESAPDFYTALFSDYSRNETKTSLNAFLNGGGVPAISSYMESDHDNRAAVFIKRVKSLLAHGGDWSEAGEWLKYLKENTVAIGAADDVRSAAGIGLMRIEAAALQSLMSSPELVSAGASVIAPLRDAVLLQAPAEVAPAVEDWVAGVMASAFFGASGHRGLVKTTLEWSWGGGLSSPRPLVARRFAARAAERVLAVADQLSSSGTVSPSFVVVACAAAPGEMERLKKANARRPSANIVGEALVRIKKAERWFWEKSRETGYPLTGRVPLESGGGSAVYDILKYDYAFPKYELDSRSNSICKTSRGPDSDGKVRVPVSENELVKDVEYSIQKLYSHIKFESNDIIKAIQVVSEESVFDPVKEWLFNLPKWDGKQRLDKWLITYAKASGDVNLIKAYGKKWIMSLMNRIMQPGCKVDSMLVLIGPQGCGKTTVFNAISPAGSFKDNVNLLDNSRDNRMKWRRHAVVEWGEMTGIHKADIEALKGVITETEDEYRKPYAREVSVYPRSLVFCGTSNKKLIIVDETGGRRFWCVEVCVNGESIDVEGLKQDSPQIWAEALVRWRLFQTDISLIPEMHKEKFEKEKKYMTYLSPDEVPIKLDADEIFQQHVDPAESLAEALLDHLESSGLGYVVDSTGKKVDKGFRLLDLMKGLGIDPNESNKYEISYGRALRNKGFTRKNGRIQDKVMKLWFRPEEKV